MPLVQTYQPAVYPKDLLETFLPPQTSSCSDLIGTPYRLGGGDGYIDCIQLVYAALHQMEIPTPTFDKDWYNKPRFNHIRDLLRWGNRVNGCSYDGDVLLLSGQGPMFGVIWEQGALHISTMTKAVSWCPTTLLENYWLVRYSPTKET